MELRITRSRSKVNNLVTLKVSCFNWIDYIYTVIKKQKKMKKYIATIYDKLTQWFLNGKRHWEGEPAVEYIDGDKFESITVNGDKFWFLNGKLHRIDGPACDYENGDKSWHLNGFHREDGPAIELVNGDKSWWLNGEKLTENEFKELTIR